jgi:hypothetical protein
MDDSCAYGSGMDGKPGCALHQVADPGRCVNCTTLLRVDDEGFAAKWQDPLTVLGRDRSLTISLRNLLAGSPAFLVGGGPSANDLPLELLGRRGVFSLAVNNAAGHPRIRPQAFVCSDPPKKFTHSVWLDPGVMKFIPTPKLDAKRGRLRQRFNGEFKPLDRTTLQTPNTWAFKRWSWLEPNDKFFLTDGACWGNHQTGAT